MIRHIVCWTLKEEGKAANAVEIKQRLEALRGQIPGMLHLEVGINAADAPQDNWDVVLLCDFEDMTDLNAYQGHPLHKEVAVFIASVRTNRVCVDYVVD